VVQLGWIARLFLPDGLLLTAFVVLVGFELLVPVIAERLAGTTFHPGHVVERYGLFTLIVLGESLLSATVAFQTALDGEGADGQLYVVAVGGVLTVFAMWWIYFAKPSEDLLTSNEVAFRWGYGHYLIFASAAAVGAGLEVGVEAASGHAELSTLAAGATVTVPVAVYLLTAWVLLVLPHRLGAARTAVYPGAAALVLLATLTAQPVLVTGIVLGALVAVSIARSHQAYRSGTAASTT